MTRADAPLDGAWERPGAGPLRSAVVGLLICGAVYTTVGALVMSIVAAVISAGDRSWLHADGLLGFLLAYYRRFQIPILVVTGIMEFAVFLGLTFLLVRRWHSSRPAAYLRYRRPAAVDLLLAGLGAVAVVPLAELLNSWSFILFPVLRELQGGSAALLSIRSPVQLVLVVVGVSLTPAVCEEALFRGWLQNTIRRRVRALPAIAVTGVVFALCHSSPLSLVALAFVGFYLGYVFERTGTLFASMTAHALYNLVIIVLANVDVPWRWLATESGDVAAPAVAGSILVFALVVAALWSRSPKPAPA